MNAKLATLMPRIGMTRLEKLSRRLWPTIGIKWGRLQQTSKHLPLQAIQPASALLSPNLITTCHDRDIPPQPSHTCSCLLTVQTPPEHSLTKPEPIPGLPDPPIAFPNSSAAFPKRWTPFPNTSDHSRRTRNISNPIDQPRACMLTSEPEGSVYATAIGRSPNA